MASNSRLIVKDLSISFGGLKALRNISFEVDKGEFVGLMGANGAGKTTLINCIARVLTPSSGTLEFGQYDLMKLPAHEIADIGIARTFQDLDFFNSIPDMMVIDYLKTGQFPKFKPTMFLDAFQTRNSKSKELEMKKAARVVLEFFREMRLVFEPDEAERGFPTLYGRDGFPDLIDVEYKPIGILSFAWRRRLDLARALVSKPKLILLDEPAQGLPPFEIQNLAKILTQIKNEFNVSALIVEHNISTLMEVSDRIVVLDGGAKIAEGTPGVIRQHPEVIEAYLGTAESKIGDKSAPEPTKIRTAEARKRDQKPVLEVNGIDVFYGQAQALFSFSMNVYPGQVVAVLGTNGSGKSTVLKTIGGQEKASVGDIYFKSEILPPGWPEAVAYRGIQYVPQGHIVFPNLTVRENLRIGGIPLETSKKELATAMGRVFEFFPQLKDLQGALATNLSGGQQQMVAIGQALMGGPDLLMLDEPSLGLAPIFVETIFSIIRRISEEERCAILLVEQNVSKALEVSDYVYILSSGSLMSHGPTQGYISDPSIIRKCMGFV